MTTVVFKQDQPPYRKAQMVQLPDAMAWELQQAGIVEVRQPMQPTETKAMPDEEEGETP